MKRLVLFLSIVFLSSPLISVAQNQDKVTGAMIITTTETIAKEPIVTPKDNSAQTNTKPKFTMMGQVGFFIPMSGGFDIHFLAGYTFRDRVFVGAGVGLNIDISSNGFAYAPLYANSRIYFTKNTKVRPFADLSVGGNIPWGVYLNTSIGAEMAVSKRLSIYAKAGYEAMHRKAHYDRHFASEWVFIDEWRIMMSHNFGFKVGLKF